MADGTASAERALKTNVAVAFFSLFASGSTLLCCALPALLVSVGAGAALAGLVTAFPSLVWLSVHKLPLFAVAGGMLFAAGIMQWRARSLPCPAEPMRAAACARARRFSVLAYGVSVAVYAVGFFFAFIAPVMFA